MSKKPKKGLFSFRMGDVHWTVHIRAGYSWYHSDWQLGVSLVDGTLYLQLVKLELFLEVYRD